MALKPEPIYPTQPQETTFFEVDDDQPKRISFHKMYQLPDYMPKKSISSVAISDLRKSKDIDDDFDTDIEDEDKPSSYDPSGRLVYEKACKMQDIPPIRIFSKSLTKAQIIDLSNYGLDNRASSAISIGLCINQTITELNISWNQLGGEGIKPVCHMLRENASISVLNISGNDLKTAGVREVIDMLKMNQSIRTIDLSSNDINDLEGKELLEELHMHDSVTEVDLSKNSLCCCGKELQRLLADNDKLRRLGLGWNHLRGDDAELICEGLQENVGLQYLDLSWNGFGNKGASHLCKSLTENGSLIELDVTANRISQDGFVILCAMLPKNATLEILRVGRNPISNEAALIVLDLIERNIESITLVTLDLSEVLLGTIFARKVNEVRKLREEFTCIFGYTDSYGKRKLKAYNPVEDAVKFLRKYTEENDIKLLDLFAELDDDGSMSVTYDEFKIGLKRAGVPVTEEQIELLIEAFDQDGDGEIDFSEFVLGTDEHS